MIKTLVEPEAENREDGGAFLDGFLSTHTLFVTTKEEGRTGLHWCQPISRTAAFLGAATSTGARSQHLCRKSRGLLPAGTAGRLWRGFFPLHLGFIVASAIVMSRCVGVILLP